MPTIDRPCFVIVGGINGSGKSTFAKHAAGTPLLLEQTAINPDDLTNAAKAKYGIEPTIWRLLCVPEALTLHRLHRVMQVVFSRFDYHLYEFRAGDRSFQAPHPEVQGDYEDSTRVTLARQWRVAT